MRPYSSAGAYSATSANISASDCGAEAVNEAYSLRVSTTLPPEAKS